ncbi:UNVERIFIED_CONTAM: hypothetical protein Sradi_0632500 [Sesamum radiatum]|uniref:Integrase catalytic domain-containing protein n=1 Tax=Sesamum radiatum TaxID=300843 RepID=A0AAW2VPS3_SESRA
MGSRTEMIDNPQVTLRVKKPMGKIHEVSHIVRNGLESWMDGIKDFLEKGKLPEDKDEAKRIRRMSARYFIEKGYLFKRKITSDNETQFQGKKFREWCHQWKIKQIFTSVGNPKANGQTEVSNRIILKNLKTKLGTAKTGWLDEIPGILWVYRTTSNQLGVNPLLISIWIRGFDPS